MILFVLIPVNYVGYRLLNKELSRRAIELQKNTSAGVQEILSYIKQIDYLKQLGSHDNVLRSIDPSIDKIYESMARVNTYAQCVSSFLGGINEVAKNLCLIYMTIQFTSHAINAYSLVTFSAILPLFFSAIGTVVDANLDRRDYTAAMNFQKEVLSQQEASGSLKIEKINTIELAVDHISLPGRNIPFQLEGGIKKGDIVKINGASGTGKSSFAKTLVKFRENEGICFDGVPLMQIDNQSLRSRVEYLSQNVPIVKGSLRDNVFFNITWSQKLEEKVLADPIMHSILQSKDMNTQILEDGGNLSGGEKQKIALVRALIKDVDVLILDEVCSNIDKESATEIYQRVASERNERITIIISHDELPANLEIIELGGR